MEPDKSQAGDVDVGSSEGGHTTAQQHNSTDCHHCSHREGLRAGYWVILRLIISKAIVIV